MKCSFGHEYTVILDNKINQRYRITADFIIATTLLSPGKMFYESALTVFGLILPRKQNDNALVRHIQDVTLQVITEEFQRQIINVNEQSMITREGAVVGSDTQYIRPQKITPAPKSMTTYISLKNFKIIHHEYVDVNETEVVQYASGQIVYKRSEYVGEARGLKFLKGALVRNPIIVHDECSVASKLIALYFGEDNEAIDYYHRKKKILEDLRKMAKLHGLNLSNGEIIGIAAMITSHFVRICTKVKKECRLQQWKDLHTQIYVGAIPGGLLLLTKFLEEYEKYIVKCSRVESTITCYNESLHGHNLRFWSKYCYQPRLNLVKQQCAHLSWNRVPQWPRRIWKDVLVLYDRR